MATLKLNKGEFFARLTISQNWSPVGQVLQNATLCYKMPQSAFGLIRPFQHFKLGHHPKLGLLSKKEERRLVTFWIPRGQSDARGQVLSKKEATRFRFVPLTEMQAMQLNNNPSGSNLRRFLRIATRDQLVQLNGATPVAWHEYLRSEPRFKLAAILDPQPAELSTFSLTSREAKSRRRLVVKEVELCGA